MRIQTLTKRMNTDGKEQLWKAYGLGSTALQRVAHFGVVGRVQKSFIEGMSWIAFKPLYKERVWGGRNLENFLGRQLPEGQVIGESWEIVDRAEAQSVTTSGGTTIRELIATNPAGMMGPDWPADRPFPILVKWLDCQERLSLQVHPPASIAPELGGEPKTENWYIADTAPGASLLVGLSAGVTREQFEQALAETRLDSCVHRIPVKAGDSILVESGRIHAIDAGNMILEIQQNSDTTYRVYDWGRVGLDGKPREMHVEQSLKSIDFDDFEPDVLRSAPGDYVLVDCREFRIRKFELTPKGQPLVLTGNEDPRLLHVVRGRVRDRLSGAVADKGENVLLPYSQGFEIEALEASLILVSDQFIGN